MKNACASDSWPVTPTSSVRPIAPIAADIANSPVCSQKPSAYCGNQSRNTTRPAIATRPISRRRASDTGDLPRPEQPRRPPQQHAEQHEVRHALGQAAAEERDLVLVARRERRRDADEQAADDRARRRVQAADDSRRDRGEREQVRRVAHTRGGGAREKRPRAGPAAPRPGPPPPPP